MKHMNQIRQFLQTNLQKFKIISEDLIEHIMCVTHLRKLCKSLNLNFLHQKTHLIWNLIKLLSWAVSTNAWLIALKKADLQKLFVKDFCKKKTVNNLLSYRYWVSLNNVNVDDTLIIERKKCLLQNLKKCYFLSKQFKLSVSFLKSHEYLKIEKVYTYWFIKMKNDFMLADLIKKKIDWHKHHLITDIQTSWRSVYLYSQFNSLF